MDAVETRNCEVRDIPPVPIKTYQWEDVRRAKTRGLYPYTHLTKDPYDREVDPEEYTMEAFRRSKSASTLGKGDSNVFIREITEEAPKTPSKDYLEVHPFSEGIVESAESSAGEDNISQYVDRDSDDLPEITEHVETPGTSEHKREEKMEVDEENRAKSEEPKRKRKLSVESSYSRMSLSRLGMMKKLREAKEKLKLPKWTFSKSDSKLDVPKKPKKSKEASAKSDRVEAKKVVGPLYIHIPLKPPPGETDEFSYLEFEDASTTPAEAKSTSSPPLADGNQESETKEDAKSDIQLIILTAPSDDETLDDHVMMPDTPSSEKSKFFENTKIRELKSLAKDVVDEISPDTKVIFEDVIQVEYVDENNRPLATTENSKIIEVTEENLPNLERQLSQRNLKTLRKELRESRESLNKLVRQREREKLRAKLADRTESLPTLVTVGKESTPPKKTTENIMVDEEDGLKLSDEAVKLIGEELAKAKTEEESLRPSASLKKKVSFKRRSKQEDPDGIYEDVQITSDKSKDADEKEPAGRELKVLETSQSMSVDEEKTYLDGDKIVKTTSLEDDYHKWSKLPDHEYEPVNPPDEGKPHQQQATPEVHVIAPSVDRDLPPPKAPVKIAGTPPPPREEVAVQSDADEALTTEEMQARIEDRFFNATVTAPPPPIISSPPPPPIVDEEPPEGQGKKIQDALRNQAEKIRSKFRNIKKPDMPKIPDQIKVSLPSFTLPKRGAAAAAKKRSLKERQLSMESNAGDSKKKLFDFSTYPRFFGKKKKKKQREEDEEPPPPPVESSTVPRTKELFSRSRWGQKLADRRKAEAEELAETKRRKDPDVVRIPLRPEEEKEKSDDDEEDKDIDIDEAYLKENQEIHGAFPFDSDFSRNRWKLGSFHGENLHEIDNKGEEEYKITDLDQDAESSPPQTPPPQAANVHSTSSSGDVHRRGVLEEINSDEFFLRQKGISQDDIEMGECLSWEIREAFRQPVNPLSQMQADDDLDASDRSLQEEQQQQKRKPIKKPKRKKTPHVSSEEVQESEPEEPQEQPPRPKRKSKKRKEQQTIPYQETIRVIGKDAEYKSVSDNVLNERCEDDRFFYRGGGFKQEYPQEMYENQRMTGDVLVVSDPYERRPFRYHDDEGLDYVDDQHPEAPPRKNRSLKSLTSEHDSITDEIKYANQEVAKQNVEAYRIEHDYIIPISEGPPVKPARTRSRTRSQSCTTQGDDDVSLPSRNGEDFAPEQQPCVEEPCVRQLCDYMGYAIVDKSKQREPPLPPPVRRRRSKDSSKSSEGAKFFTVPRPLKDEAPVRPLRNYSTLVPKERRSTTNITDEEKENIHAGNLNQYIEIEEEGHSRVLKSGDVIQKMKDRPLPAPPRPPRKHKPVLKDVTHEENIEEEKLEETEASVQTEPLPDDFVCEELVEDKNDKIMTPSRAKAVQDKSEKIVTPDKTEFEHQETITHGALVVAPVPAGYQEGPLTSFSRSTERVVTVKRESAPPDEETSQVPEEFKKLAEPEIKVLKTQKLQVGDLDVDRLTVNELLASKITVSEIDGGSIAVSEINPRSGNIVFAGVELPAGLLRELVQRLQAIQTSGVGQRSEDDDTKTADTKPEIESQIDTKPEENLLDEIESQIISDVTSTNESKPQPELEPLDKPMAQPEEESSEAESVPPLERGTDSAEEEARLIEDLKRLSDEQKKTSFEDDDLVEGPPQRPPRQSDYQRQLHSDSSERGRRSETPPPRPPQPEDILETVYLRSQPPPSFYTMRSPAFHEIPSADDIPLPPRRRRQQKTLSRSSSDEAPPRSRRHRTPPEASVPELAGQLTRACATAGEKALKRLIKHITSHVLQNTDGRQDTHVMVVILLVLIAGLILLGWGDGKTVHYHHWEYFNPPRDT